jgi:hypothetical protein
MRKSPFQRHGRPSVCWAALLMIMAAFTAGAAPSAKAFGVPWSSLTLQASRFGSTATAEIGLEVLPAATETPKFIDGGKGQPLSASGPEVLRMTIVTTLDTLADRRVRLENQLWFDPLTHKPLYLIRTRFGYKDYYQRFRFTREGVFRQQRQPASSEELKKPPEFWTKLDQNFYPYPSDRHGCSSVIETSMLITLVDAVTADPYGAAGSVCVFHKRQVHRVSVQSQLNQEVSFNYLEKRAGEENRRVGTVSALGVSIASRPIGSYRGEVEDFFRDGSQIYLSPENQLPLVVSGELPLIGRVDLQLKEIHLK